MRTRSGYPEPTHRPEIGVAVDSQEQKGYLPCVQIAT